MAGYTQRPDHTFVIPTSFVCIFFLLLYLIPFTSHEVGREPEVGADRRARIRSG